ncbi:MAG: acyclic terpene utilization AtuA family protein [Armatimonadota bacterium]|nr:acyclic terpene utilization AtuA family protein [Armatimonadota bacterium]
MRTVRVGNGSAYWGDMLDPAIELAAHGELDYLGLDHLAELTLAILQRTKAQNPQQGYIPDLAPWMEALLPISRRTGVRLITNAGGANPQAGAQAVVDLARRLDLDGLRIGVVTGDDVLPLLDRLVADGVRLVNLDTGEEGLDRIRSRIVAANAYLGSDPIVEALKGGADVVITGRVTDSALAIAPLLREFGWGGPPADWDRIGAAIIIGHILECACFCTGGGSNQWREVPEPWRIGFPLAEVAADGTAVITKVPGSGGLVTQWTVKEQLTYEVTDPTAYVTPDGVADFTGVQVEEVGPNRVRVTGMRGRPKPNTLKVCIGYWDGWIAEGLLLFSWPDALAKAQRAEEIVRRRLQYLQVPVEDIRFDYVGVNTLHGAVAPPPSGDLNEVGLRISARCPTPEAADAVRREATHLWTLGGVGTAFGVPFRPRPVVALWPTLVPRDAVVPRVEIHTV